MNILDIDLDFFQTGAEYFRQDNNGERLCNKNIKPWSIKNVVDFLENKCHLDKQNKILGKVVEHHHEVLNLWSILIEKNKLIPPFSVYHVDAHADLGLGDCSYIHILTDLIHKPLNERIIATFEGSTKLNCGNYLAYAIANRWLKDLHFIINKSWRSDLFPYYIIPPKDYGYGHHHLHIQLRKFSLEQLKSSSFKSKLFQLPFGYEPKIPFEIIPLDKFDEVKKFDYIFLSKSPNYTKAETDSIIPIILDYMDIENFELLIH
ncbi:MAG: UPF0489 family protein [Candidatus Pacearchaeota archaeon]|jgi:hypothetical protein